MSAPSVTATEASGLAAALGYAARGWRVVPLHHVRDNGTCSCSQSAGPNKGQRFDRRAGGWIACEAQGKHPRPAGWQKIATTDERQIRAWWARQPADGVGVATGLESGLLVLDIDPDNGGDATLAALETQHGRLPGTYTVITGSGGTHLYFAWPARARRDGREWRNSAGKLGAGLDTRGSGGQVVAPPSVSAKGTYDVATDGPLAECPGWLLDLLDAPKTQHRDTEASNGATVTRLPTAADDDRLVAYVRRAVDSECQKIIDALDGAQNNALNGAAFSLGTLVAVGALTEHVAQDALTEAARIGNHPPGRAASTIRSGLDAGMRCPRTPWPPKEAEHWQTSAEAELITNREAFVFAAMWDANLTQEEAEAAADAAGWTADGAVPEVRTALPVEQPTPVPVVELGEPAELRGDLLASLRKLLHLPDAAPVLVVMAAAVTAVEAEADEPVWIQVVGASSSGKTEAVRLLGGVQVANLDEVTEAGLLSWTKGKNPKPTGVLARVRHGLVTFGDFSTLLAGADRGGRDKVFAALRRIYDGSFSRDVQPAGGSSQAGLSWTGRITIVSAVTGEIDRQLAFAQALGERWLYVRIADASRQDQRAAARKARSVPAGVRGEAEELATRLVRSAQARLSDVDVPDTVLDAIEDVAQVTAWGRATVPRNSYGTQEITGEAVVEGVGRLVKQLIALARGLLALDLSEEDTAALCRRVALDSMPTKRRRTLEALAKLSEPATAGPIARLADLDRKLVRRVCEELEAVGVVTSHHCPDEEDIGPVPDEVRTWALTDEEGHDVRAVFSAPRAIRR